LRAYLESYKKLIAFGLMLRFAICFWTGHPWDFEVFIRVGYYIAHGSSLFQAANPYVAGLGQPIFPNMSGLGYLPAWGLYTAFAYKIYQAFPASPFIYYFLLKLLPILGDLALAYVIFLLTFNSTHDVQKARRNSLIFFLCPFVIFISSVWGMFDSISVSFAMISILLTLLDKPYWSAFSLGLGIYFKVIPLLYLPVLLLFINKKKGAGETVLYFLVSSLTPFVFTLIPVTFFRWSIPEAAITVLSQTEKTGDLLTYWNISVLLRDLAPNVFSTETLTSFFSFPIIRYFWMLGLMVAYFLYYKLQTELPDDSTPAQNLNLLLKGFLFVTIGFLLTRTWVPEQFVIYLLPMAVMLTGVMPVQKYYELIWINALIFASVNLFPFAFAYLINTDFWNMFNYVANTQPSSTIRYVARFVIAVFFDYYLLKFWFKMVKTP